jgi:hypothetical protein
VQTLKQIVVIVSLLPLLLVTVQTAYPEEDTGFDEHIDPYFGITLLVPADWYIEGDNPWSHSDINPWHLPMTPIKELQPTPVDILRESKKTLISSFEPADETGASMRLSVEKMPFGATLDYYADYTVERIERNGWTDIFVTEKSNIVLSDGNPAIKLVVTGADGSFRSTQLLSLYGNLAYIIQYEAPLEYYDVYIETANVALGSVSITPPQSRAQALLVPMIVAIVVPAAIGAIKIRNKNSQTA